MSERKEKQDLTEAQQRSLRLLNRRIVERRTKDFARLTKDPGFLRYIGEWTKKCGVHNGIRGMESNNVFFREGMRTVGEEMMAQLKQFNLEASFEMERSVRRDEEIRQRIINEGKSHKGNDEPLEKERQG